jgi:hypothetical protein
LSLLCQMDLKGTRYAFVEVQHQMSTPKNQTVDIKMFKFNSTAMFPLKLDSLQSSSQN